MVSTTAGDFDCEWMKIYGKQVPGLELLPLLDKNYYADGIGKIFNTVSFATEEIHIMERRLKSYDIQ
jgi:hypothetical protein